MARWQTRTGRGVPSSSFFPKGKCCLIQSWENIRRGNTVAIYIFPRTTWLGDTEYFFFLPKWHSWGRVRTPGELIGDNEVQVLLRFTQRSGKHTVTYVPIWWGKQGTFDPGANSHACARGFPAACTHTTPVAVLSGAPTTPRDTACLLCPISFSQAARAECLLTGRHGLSPAWRPLGQDSRGQTSFSGLSSPCLAAGQRQGGLPTPADWGFIQVLMDAETTGRLKAAILLTGTPTGVWSEQTGLRSSRVVPSPLRNHQVLTQTLHGQPLLINLSGPSQSFSIQVPVP